MIGLLQEEICEFCSVVSAPVILRTHKGKDAVFATERVNDKLISSLRSVVGIEVFILASNRVVPDVTIYTFNACGIVS